MAYFFTGLMGGAVLSIFLFLPQPSFQIYPEFYGTIENINRIELSPSGNFNGAGIFPVRTDSSLILINGTGRAVKRKIFDEALYSFSGNGLYYVRYYKTGREVEFYNIDGERFWKKGSREYPSLSFNGRIVPMVNGDQSRVRILDNNGNETGEKSITGKLCTVISFSDPYDNAGIGFLDGNYYFINDRGRIINKGKVPGGNIIKSIALSRNSNFAAVHYGNTEFDFVRIIDIGKKKYFHAKLRRSHKVKTAIFVTNRGLTSIIDYDNLLGLSSDGNILFRIVIPPMREGFAKISYNGNIFAAAYTIEKGPAKLLVFREKGDIIFSKEYQSEKFLDPDFNENLLFLRGSRSLFCYSFHF